MPTNFNLTLALCLIIFGTIHVALGKLECLSCQDCNHKFQQAPLIINCDTDLCMRRYVSGFEPNTDWQLETWKLERGCAPPFSPLGCFYDDGGEGVKYCVCRTWRCNDT